MAVVVLQMQNSVFPTFQPILEETDAVPMPSICRGNGSWVTPAPASIELSLQL